VLSGASQTLLAKKHGRTVSLLLRCLKIFFLLLTEVAHIDTVSAAVHAASQLEDDSVSMPSKETDRFCSGLSTFPRCRNFIILPTPASARDGDECEWPDLVRLA
jgi:hypothetical protein